MVWVAQVFVTVYGAKDVNNKVLSDFTMTCTAKRKTCLTNVEKRNQLYFRIVSLCRIGTR